MITIDKINNLRNQIKSHLNHSPILGSFIKIDNEYYLDLSGNEWEFPEFKGSEETAINNFYAYVLDHKYIHEAILDLVKTGCKYPIMIIGINPDENGMIPIYNGYDFIWK